MLFYCDGRYKDVPCEEPFDNHDIVLSDPEMELTDSLIIKYFKDMLVNFNSGLRGGETPRIFKGVKRLVKYTYKNGNTTEKYVWVKKTKELPY